MAASTAVSPGAVNRVVDLLASTDEADRTRGVDALHDLLRAVQQHPDEVTPELAERIAQAATLPIPDGTVPLRAGRRTAGRGAYFPSWRLLEALEPHAELVDPDLLRDTFPRLPETGRFAALRLLGLAPGREASLVLAALLAQVDDLPYSWHALEPLERAPKDADVLVPAIVEAWRITSFEESARNALVNYAEARSLGTSADEVLARAAEKVTAGIARLATAGDERDTFDARLETVDDLRLLVALERPETRTILESAAANPNEWIAGFGALGLVRLGDEPVDALTRAAEEPRCRAELFRALQRLGQLDLLPERHRSQAALAVSELALELARPEELGEPPGRFEVAAIEPLDHVGEQADVFVLRFRYADDREWSLGIPGAYLRSEQPTVHALGFATGYEDCIAEGDEPVARYVRRIAATWYGTPWYRSEG